MKSQKLVLIGRVLSTLIMLPFTMGIYMSLTRNPEAMQGMARYGMAESLVIPIGLLDLICCVLYCIPQTAVLGAVLLTGYLGGAVLTHLRVGEPFLMPVVFGVIIWLGLYLREPRLRALLPLRKKA